VVEIISSHSREIEVYGRTNVLVVGGGFGGIAASIAAAQSGKKVTLVEKACILGGMATLGHVCIYLPLDDGVGNKVFGGLAEELLHLCIKRSYNTLSSDWKKNIIRVENPSGRYRTHFNIPAAVFSFDEVMEQLGVNVIFDAVFSEPIMDDQVCKGVVLETKQGRIAYMADMVVDASGDADVFYRAGASCVEQKSIVSHWCYELEMETMAKAIESGKVVNAMKMRWLGLRPGVNNDASELPRFSGTTIDGVNDYIQLSRKLAREYLDQRDNATYAMTSLPLIPQFRMTRRITGIKELDTDSSNQFKEDSIGCVCNGLACPAPVYELPYGTLIDPHIKNMIAAGRIIAASGDGWEMMRLIPACAFTGQVAGTAASIAIDQGSSVQDVDIKILQKSLEKTGVIIHIPQYMKGNVNTTVIEPKIIADPLVNSDALSYH
jgi:hypothetical protein